MKDLKIKLSVFLILIFIFILISCNTTRYNLPVFNRSNDYPEGVDSLIVSKSDSIIANLFVDFAGKQKAEKLAKQAQDAFTQADSIWKKLEKFQADSAEKFSEINLDSTTAGSNILRKKIIDFLVIAEKNFLQAIKFDPFPLHIKNGLAQTYMLWARIEKPGYYYEKALSGFKDMANYERGEHLLFYKLGECYFQLNKWDQALFHYRQAEKILLETEFYADSVVLQAQENDSIKKELHFNYLYSQAVCLSRMYEAEKALSMLKSAKDVASSTAQKKIAERFEDWLNWDNGNIHAAEEKNDILELIKNRKYGEAVERFEKLKHQLTDPYAIDEIDWRIAGLEFNYLNKKQVACNRLLGIIKKHRSNRYNSPQLVALFDKYVTDCGTMHYHLGMDYVQKAEFKQAHQFMAQGAKLDWYGKYKCKLELAKLTRHDPKASLQIIEEVLHDQENLTNVERLAALEIKLIALRKLGPQYLNETKQIYHQIRELQNK